MKNQHTRVLYAAAAVAFLVFASPSPAPVSHLALWNFEDSDLVPDMVDPLLAGNVSDLLIGDSPTTSFSTGNGGGTGLYATAGWASSNDGPEVNPTYFYRVNLTIPVGVVVNIDGVGIDHRGLATSFVREQMQVEGAVGGGGFSDLGASDGLATTWQLLPRVPGPSYQNLTNTTVSFRFQVWEESFGSAEFSVDNLYIDGTAIPEPAGAALLFGAVGIMGLRRHRLVRRDA